MTTTCLWMRTAKGNFTYSKACGGFVTFFAGKPSDHVCTCGKKAVGRELVKPAIPQKEKSCET